MKKDLRQVYITKRKEISTSDREIYSQQIATHFLNSEWMEYETFHIFIPIDKFNEINTRLIIQELWAKNKTVVVPKMKGKALLNCAYTPETLLAKNSWGIEEPKNHKEIPASQIDVVIVPMLIADKNGNRIGYGGGFYDRFLPTLRRDVQLVGINYFEPIAHIDHEEHDIPLDALITPKGVVKF
ncbi:5-formyltetrahydrofolate cyclo-ligase [Flavobacteriaceae bacterium Ap0902]|nr:5-formyltetrahydrofolate cyclo-ligase [Flavobacteriaceae bacterium Ap0902]